MRAVFFPVLLSSCFIYRGGPTKSEETDADTDVDADADSDTDVDTDVSLQIEGLSPGYAGRESRLFVSGASDGATLRLDSSLPGSDEPIDGCDGLVADELAPTVIADEDGRAEIPVILLESEVGSEITLRVVQEEGCFESNTLTAEILGPDEIDPDDIGHTFVGSNDIAAGSSVAFAGDTDGDGLDDLLVGAPNYNFGTGLAYWFYGEGDQTMGNYEVPTQGGTPSPSYFGYSVAGAGDIDNDGLADTLVGAPYFGNPIGGVVYFTYGDSHDGGGLFNDVSTDDSLGASLAGDFDVNDDGIDDFLVGAPGAAQGKGEVIVQLGSNQRVGGFVSGDITFTGADSDGHAGESASAGDVDGDGVGDLLIGAPDAGSPSGGVVYVISGRSGLPSSLDAGDADVIIEAEQADDALGYSVSGALDVDGDGIEDMLVGAPGDTPSSPLPPGRVYLLTRPASGAASQAAAILVGDGPGQAGFSLDSAGDVDADGYGDVLVAAPFAASLSGRVYLLHGPLYGEIDLAAADVTFSDGPPNSNMGLSVAGGGDVDGDGRSDLLIGAPGAANLGGMVYLVLGADL